MEFIGIVILVLVLATRSAMKSGISPYLYLVAVFIIITYARHKKTHKVNGNDKSRKNSDYDGSYSGSVAGEWIDLGGGQNVNIHNPDSIVDGVNWVKSSNGDVYSTYSGESFTYNNGHYTYDSGDSNNSDNS